MHGRRPLDEKKNSRLFFQDLDTVTPAKLYTRKELLVVERYIADFHTSFYIPEIKKLAFHLPHVHIIGTSHCGNTSAKHSHVAAQSKMCFVVVIMTKEW